MTPACSVCGRSFRNNRALGSHQGRSQHYFGAWMDQRHADAERHSEARAGGVVARRCATEHHDHGDPAEAARFWTRLWRQDRQADYFGQPPTMPGPILDAASASAE